MGDEETPSGSIEDRISHKNWKWRVSGLEELTTKFKHSLDSSGPLFNEWGPQWKKILADINPMSQEKALEPLLAFIDRCDCVAKFAAGYTPILVEKLFASSRPRAKEKTIECLLMTIEADASEPVVEALLKGTESTSPKILLASLLGLTQALKTFGPKQVPIKLILKQFSPWFENRDKNIRDQASELFIEIYRWIGKALLPLINDALTPIQLKALQDQFEKLPNEPAVPLKYTRSEAAKVMANAQKGIEAKPEVVEEIDPYSLMSAVNILPKITSEFYEGLASKKWQERSEQMDKLVTLLQNTPKIENADFGELCKALKKVLADTNVIIMTKAIVSIGLLAEALRGSFSGYVKQFITPMLERYKEKKASIVQSIHTTMGSLISKCISLADIIDDITAVMQSKVPNLKQEVLNFVGTSITNSKKPAEITKVSKQLAKIFMESLNDTTDTVRDASANAFAALGGVLGERGMTPYLNQIDPIKAKKIKENMPAVTQTQAVLIPTPTAPVIVDLDLPPPPSGSSGKKPAATATSAASSSTKSSKTTTTTTTATTKTSSTSTSSSSSISIDDSKNKLSNIISNEIIEGLGKANWKERLQATDDLLETIKGLTADSLNGMSEYIIVLLADKPSLKETNFQVLANVLSIITQCAKNDSSFSLGCVNHYLTTCIEKLSDIKLKEVSSELMSVTAEAVSPQSVFSIIYSFTSNHKNPKTICDSLVWIQSAVDEFGIGCCTTSQHLRQMIDYIKTSLENTNPDVKKCAIKLLCTLKINVGSQLSDYLNDVKKQLLDTIEKEFVKIRDQKPPTPTRQWKGMPPPGTVIELPRTDISAKITPNIISNISDANWKTRSDALDEVERIIIDANRKIQPKLGGLVPALKNRLTDNNQKVIITTLNIIGMLSQSIGSAAFEKNARLLIPGILLLLNDSKKPIRDAVLNCMTTIQLDLGFDVFVGFLAAPMIQESINTRKESLAWSIANAGNFKQAPVPSEINTLAKGIVACLQDKSAEIRSLADNLLSILCTLIPAVEFKKELKSVKPANQPTIQTVLDKYYQKGGAPIQQPTKSTSKTASSPTPSSPQPSRSQTPTHQQQQQQPVQQQQQPIQQADRRSILSNNSSSNNGANSDIIIFNPNGKLNRQKTNDIKCWLFDEPSEEVLEILQDQVLQCFTEEFANLMFSSLPSNSQSMADHLVSTIENNPEAIISVLDILFRWITFKLFDTGVASQKRVLKILETLLSKLIELEYSMNEYEASCLVPILLEKSGSSTNDVVKQVIKQSIIQLEELCLPNVLFRFAVEVVSSQNWRTRVETLNVMASIIDKNGASVCGNNLKVIIPLIAQNLNDPQVKQSSVNCLSKLYCHIKDECFKYFNFSNQDKSLISGGASSGSGGGVSSSGNNNSGQQQQRKSLTNQQQQQQQNQPTDEISSQLIACLDLLKAYNVTKDNIEHTVEALKQFSGMIANTKIADKFMNFSEEYFIVLTSILSDIFPQVFRDATIFRLCKYLIHTIISIYSNISVAKQCNVRCLEIVLTETIKLYSLTESNTVTGGANTDSEWLSKAFNQILLRTLQNSNSTILFSTLLQMMTRSKNDQTIQHPDKYNDLLLRCLLRATKSLKTPAVLTELNVDTVLAEINSFLDSNPSLDETTRKTTKTLTSELYQSKSAQVIKFTKDIVANNQQQNYQPLFNLLIELVPKQFDDLLVGGSGSGSSGRNSNVGIGGSGSASASSSLNNINISKTLDSPATTTTTATATTTSRPRTSTGSSTTTIQPSSTSTKTHSTLSQLKTNKEPRDYSGKTDSQKKEILQEIFKKIGNKDLTMDGIYDLYYFLKEYPDYDITPNLNSSSQQFQTYITRNLKKVKDSIESPKDKEDEIVNYQERLKVIQNTFYNQQNPSSSALNDLKPQQVVNSNNNNNNNHTVVVTNNHHDQQHQQHQQQQHVNPQLSNTASMASNTLQRLKNLNPSDQNNNNNSNNNTPPTPISNDLNSTLVSLRQRLAQLTSKSNE